MTEYCLSCFTEICSNALACPACNYTNNEKRDMRALPARYLLKGNYTLGKTLGAGGFGITYLAKDRVLGRIVAIKEYLPRAIAGRDRDGISITPHSVADESSYQYGLDKFISEAKILAKFNHPNLIKAYEVFQENETAYLVMEYVPGLTLDDFCKSREGDRLNENEAVTIMLSIMDGLREVHEAGFVHRDVKPQNIYIASDGRVLLLDFGGARDIASQNSYSIGAISSGYSPIEQYQQDQKSSKTVGPWTDVYACGVTLYKLLTGETPPDSLLRSGSLTWKIAVNPSLRKSIEAATTVKYQDRIQDVVTFQKLLTGKVTFGNLATAKRKVIFASRAIVMLLAVFGAIVMSLAIFGDFPDEESKPVAAQENMSATPIKKSELAAQHPSNEKIKPDSKVNPIDNKLVALSMVSQKTEKTLISKPKKKKKDGDTTISKKHPEKRVIEDEPSAPDWSSVDN